MSTKLDWTLAEYFSDKQHREKSAKRRNQIILLSIAGVLIIASVVSLLYVVWSGSSFARHEISESAESPSLTIPSTALQAYTLAQNSAQQWKSDGMLFKASATWNQGPDRESLLDGSEIWSFRFHSPGNSKTANFTVIEGEPKLMNQQNLDPSIQLASIESWNIDSNTALLKMLDEGGESFLSEHENTTLTMALTAGVERGRPEWLISVFGDEANNYFNIRIDASTGDVLDSFQSP